MATMLTMPKLGLTMEEGKIVEWLNREGDLVEEGQTLYVIETEKVTYEVESPEDGLLVKILAEVGQSVPVGGSVGILALPGEDWSQLVPEAAAAQEPAAASVAQPSSPVALEQQTLKATQGEALASPLARKLAEEKGIPLSAITPKDPNGPIYKRDVLAAKAPAPGLPMPETNAGGELVPLTTMRSTIAQRMSFSASTIPHFWLQVEVDGSALKEARKKLLAKIQADHNVRLNVTDILIKLTTIAIKEFPNINASWTDAGIRLFNEVNIGLAVDVPNGLIVPVIKQAEGKNLAQIAKDRVDLVAKARDNKLTPDIMTGSTFTFNNVGGFGLSHVNSIINPPESAILGIGAMKERPVAIDGQLVIRPMFNLTLACDHRVLDGGYGSRFLARLKELIEDPYLHLLDKNIVVIGGGPGGYVAAIRAAQKGAQVTLVEKDALGGTCTNRGCIPTKTLLEASGLAANIKSGDKYGLSVKSLSMDFARLHEYKAQVVKQLSGGVETLLKRNKVEIIKDQARLTKPGKVELKNSKRTIEADEIILAAGSEPIKLSISGVNGKNVLDSDEFLNLESLPKSAIVIGGGYVGLEFAQFLTDLGCETTIIEMMPHLLPGLDSDLAEGLKSSMESKGTVFKTNTTVTSIRDCPEGKKVFYSEGEDQARSSVIAEMVLVVVGRKPALEGLGLEKLGLEAQSGSLSVNEYMETDQAGLYAIGDVIGGIMLAHVAMAEAECAVDNIFGFRRAMDYRAVPKCIYTHPEIASVGLSEEEARSRLGGVIVAKVPYVTNGRAVLMGQSQGLLKLVADKRTKRLEGVHIMGPYATEMIAEAVLALQNNLTLYDMASSIHAHPTVSEALGEAVHLALGHPLHVI